VQEGIDGLDDGTDVGFCASSPNADFAGLLGQLPGEMDGDHEDWDFREKLGNLPGYVKSVLIGHLEIEQNHVRGISFYALKRFSAGPRLVADLPGALLLEQRP